MDNMVNTLCIVQARLTSTRLPNKVLMELGSSKKNILEHVNERLNMSHLIDQVVFAIPDSPLNDKLEQFLVEKKIPYFRGNEDNVLERYTECARYYGPRIVVRATCDNPCVDWKQVDTLISGLGEQDYVSSQGAPLGTSVEVFKIGALYYSYEHASLDPEKEHVTPFIYRHPDLFKFKKIPYHIPGVNPYRLTVDTELDFAVNDLIYKSLYNGKPIPNEQIYEFLNKNEDIWKMNISVEQKKVL